MKGRFIFRNSFLILTWDGHFTVSVYAGQMRDLCPWLWFGFAAYVKKYRSKTLVPDEIIMNDLLVAYARGFEWRGVKVLAAQIEHPIRAGGVYRAFCEKLFAQGRFEEARECGQLWLQSFTDLSAEVNKKEYQLRLRWLFNSRDWPGLSNEFGLPDRKTMSNVFSIKDGVIEKGPARIHLKSNQIFKARIAVALINFCIETNADVAGNPLLRRCRKSRQIQHKFFSGLLASSLGMSQDQWLDIARAAYNQSPNT